MVELDLEYNTERKHLIIPEYGRAVHKMVDYCTELADRDERNRCAKSIISIMGNLFPQLRDVEDYRHKLWDHMFIMSEFRLDVDSPYPRPTPETLTSKPEKINYPKGNIRYGHYGRVTQQFIEKAISLENPELKEKMAIQIFFLMKRSYRAWNRDHVEDEVVLGHLLELSKGAIKLDPSKVSGGDGLPNEPKGTGSNTGFKKKWTNNKNKNPNNKNSNFKNNNNRRPHNNNNNN